MTLTDEQREQRRRTLTCEIRWCLETGRRTARFETLAVVELLAAYDETRKDAERYRWLRDVAEPGEFVYVTDAMDAADMDARIDAAMEET